MDVPGCAPSDLLKFNLSSDERAASTRFAQQILLSAALDGRPVRLVIPTDRCLYGNPTIVSAWLVAR